MPAGTRSQRGGIPAGDSGLRALRIGLGQVGFETSVCNVRWHWARDFTNLFEHELDGQCMKDAHRNDLAGISIYQANRVRSTDI